MGDIEPTTEQRFAAAWLRAAYGGESRTDWPYGESERNGRVRVVGVDTEGRERARWIVQPDGSVDEGWDPDFSLDGYSRERGQVTPRQVFD